jgi:SET domain
MSDVHLVIRLSSKGRGVHTRTSIPQEIVVLCDPVIVFPDKAATGLIHKYTFDWGHGMSALALGLGSLMNHSFNPNVVYATDHRLKVIRFRSLRAIEFEEELCINYNGDPRDQTPVVF